MRLSKALELLQFEQVAFDLGVRRDHRRARRPSSTAISPKAMPEENVASRLSVPFAIGTVTLARPRARKNNPDQMLVLLAPEKVAALSPLARDPALSFVAPQAANLPIVRASAEAVLRLHPDLILAAQYGAQTTLALLQQERLPVLRIALPQDFAGIRRPPVCSRPHWACRSGAQRCSPRWPPALAALPHPTQVGASSSGNRVASPPGRAG